MTNTERQRIESIISVDLMALDYGLTILHHDLDEWPARIIVHDYTILTVGLGYTKENAIKCIRNIADRIHIELPHGIID